MKVSLNHFCENSQKVLQNAYDLGKSLFEAIGSYLGRVVKWLKSPSGTPKVVEQVALERLQEQPRDSLSLVDVQIAALPGPWTRHGKEWHIEPEETRQHIRSTCSGNQFIFHKYYPGNRHYPNLPSRSENLAVQRYITSATGEGTERVAKSCLVHSRPDGTWWSEDQPGRIYPDISTLINELYINKGYHSYY